MTDTTHASIAINDREELRVATREFKGKKALDIRMWYLQDGTMHPGKGAWIPKEAAPTFIAIILRDGNAILEALSK